MNDAVAQDNRYQYNGKEWNDDWGLRWNDYGNRWQEAAVGRFTSIDRFSEMYYALTPYQYGANSPIRFIDVDGDSISMNFSSKASQNAFKEFFNTKVAKAFISNFAAKGQTLFGHKFTENGKYHSKGVDLNYKDSAFAKGRENTGAVTEGGKNGGRVIGGRLKLSVNVNTNKKDAQFGKLTTLVHESFLHVHEYVLDFSDNKRVDFSHDSYYKKLGENSPSRRHHILYHNKENASGSHALYTQGSQVLHEYNNSKKSGYTHKQIFEAIWNFAD
mgnify:CR=1 FL=1